MNTSSDEWVSKELGHLPQPAMPEGVVSRLDAVIADELARRKRGDLAAEAVRDKAEIIRRSSPGTYGNNAPTHFDKQGLGLELPHLADH